MKRLLVLVLLTVFGASLTALPPAYAGGDDKKDGKGQKDGKKDAKEKDPKDTAEWKECAAIAREFQSADAAGIAARIRKDGSATISLDESGSYSRDQAAPVLEKWFKGKMDLTVEVTSVRDSLGTCKLTYRPEGAGKKKTVEKTLLITIEKKGKSAADGFCLVSLSLV